MITKLKLSNYITIDQKLEALYEKIDFLFDYQKPKFLKPDPVIELDGLKGNTFYVSLNGIYTLDVKNVIPGESGYIKVYNVGVSTLTPPAGSKIANGGSTIPLTSTIGSEDIVAYYMDEREILNFSVISNLS